jgi:hypothetical protein
MIYESSRVIHSTAKGIPHIQDFLSTLQHWTCLCSRIYRVGFERSLISEGVEHKFCSLDIQAVADASQKLAQTHPSASSSPFP